MFNRKTVFIIGAGAGFDVDLPVGRELAENIARRTRMGLEYGRLSSYTADPELALSFFERNEPNTDKYLAAFNLIRDGVLLSNSIDDFLNIHEGSPEVVTVGKAAIVRSILAAERDSKLFVDPSNAYNKLDVSKIRDSWFAKFMQVLGPGRKAPDVERVLEGISFIVFNYDRCLEQFLTASLPLLYGIQRERAAEIVNAARIIHPYGWVGPLNKVPFGGNEHARLDYRELSTRIKTYTEQIEEKATLFRIQEALGAAECIVFLGFAYHRQNMDLLFDRHSSPLKTTPIFGTALGMSDADKQEVFSELSELFPEMQDEDDPDDMAGMFEPKPALRLELNDHIHIENKLSCAQLFDYYAKSLAG